MPPLLRQVCLLSMDPMTYWYPLRGRLRGQPATGYRGYGDVVSALATLEIFDRKSCCCCSCSVSLCSGTPDLCPLGLSFAFPMLFPIEPGARNTVLSSRKMGFILTFNVRGDININRLLRKDMPASSR